MNEIVSWISDKELEGIYTSDYWNDIEEEKSKEWWIEDGNYEKCLNYLEDSHLLEEYNQSVRFIRNYPKDSIEIADLAAGIGWTSALLSKLPNINKVHAVEISKHRLGSLFQHSFKMMEGDENKISRYLGSFYDLKFKAKSIDIVYLSQAFHHAENPMKLLAESDRILKDGGRIILVGEHYIRKTHILSVFLSNLIHQRKITRFYEMFSPNQKLGDHYYKCSDYYCLFGVMGYKLNHYRTSKNSLIFVAEKPLPQL